MNEIITKIEEVDDRDGGYVVTTSEQVIKLLIDNESSCCESWGWFWSNDNPQDFIGAELLEVSITDTELNAKKLAEHSCDTYYRDLTMFVNLKTSVGVLQFVAYNHHDGYYGHMARVESKQLMHEEFL